MRTNIAAYIDRLSKRGLFSITATLLVLIVFSTLPFYFDVDESYFGYYIFITCIYIIAAQSWNLVGGYAGQCSLGQYAFFGIGAYTMAGLWLNGIGLYFFFDFTLIIAAGIAPAILAILVGIPLLSRLRGDYFAFGTLGMGMIVTVIFLKGGDITGGAIGLNLDSSRFTSMRIYYWVGILLAFLSTLAVHLLVRSRIGLALKAIREDDMSASTHGISILRFKVFAFAVAAFMAGVAGCVYGYYLFHLEPASVLSTNWLFYPILIVVLGGTGTVLGPVIGSLVVSFLFAYGDVYFSGYHPVFSGLLIMLVMRFMPDGIMGLMVKAPTLWSKKGRAVSPEI